MTRRGLWVSTGMVVTGRSGLAALTPFVFESVLWAVPEGVVDDEPRLAASADAWIDRGLSPLGQRRRGDW
jgi:hypothetical protein